MVTSEKETSDKSARPRGSGGDLQSKGMLIPAPIEPDASQQPEDRIQPEEPGEAMAKDS